MNLLLPLPIVAAGLLIAAVGVPGPLFGAPDGTPTPVPAATPGAPAPSVAPSPEPAAADPASMASPGDATADAPPAPTPDPAAIKEVASLNSADALWDYIQKYSNLDDVQPDTTLSQQEQVRHVQQAVGTKISHLQPAVTRFLRDFPHDPRRYEAKLLRLLFLKDTDHITNDETDKVLHEVAAASDAPLETRQHARGALLENAVQEADPSAGLTDALEKELASYEKDFPDDANGARFVTLRLRYLGAAGPEKTKALLETLVKSPNHATSDAARTQLALRTEPLTLKLKDIDGHEIDLAKFRGKVVMLDFWATWCVPCMMTLPEVLEVNKKYGGKDFQIIGISLDQDLAALQRVIKLKHMDWPEVNDPQSFEGKVAGTFGIELIPTIWLLDREGRAHPLPIGADLDAEVAKLVSAK